jgi:hypothetical protein
LKNSYDALAQRINGLTTSDLRKETVGDVKGLPFHVIRAGNETATRRVFLSAGMHGDEPAGVEAVLRFLERDISSLYKDTSFLVLPCLNPTGYTAGTRENDGGVDLNRAYDDDDVVEVTLVKSLLKGEVFDIGIDCHEDYDGKGFYFYEGHQEGENIGDRVTERVTEIGAIDVDTDPSDAPLFPGVYPISESWGTVGLSSYLLVYNTRHVYMGETPSTEWNLEQRAEAHLAVIDTALDAHPA